MRNKAIDSSAEGVISIIPARSGSKRFPDKNITYLGSKRLLEWVISAALTSKAISRVYVSTDSDRYAEIAKNAGAIPLKRPAQLSTETATSEAVIGHALDHLSRIDKIAKIIVLQQPTSPLTKTETIAKAIAAVRGGFDSALSVFPAQKKPWWALKMNSDGSLEPFMHLPKEPQYSAPALQPLYYPTGGVYAFKAEFFRRTNAVYGGRAYGVLVDWQEAIDIDCEYDLEFAKYVLEHSRQGTSNV